MFKRLLVRLLVFTLIVSVIPYNSNVKADEETNVVDADEEIKKIELHEERTEKSKTYQNSDGSLTTEIYQHEVHFKDKRSNKWLEIDNNLVNGSNGEVINKANSFKVSFSKKPQTNEPIFELNEDNMAISLTPIKSAKSKKPKEPKSQIDKNKIIYQDAFDNTDITYSVGNSQVKEDIILKEKPLPNSEVIYSFELGIEGLTYELTNGKVLLKDKKTKEPLYYLEKPFMYDSFKPEGFKSFSEEAIPEDAISYDVKMDVQQQGEKLLIDIIPNKEWLLDDERVYPVVIDPTIIKYQPTVDLIDTNIRSAFPNQTGGADLELGVGLHKNSTTTNVIRSLVKFDIPDFPKGFTVLDAELNLWASSVWNNNAIRIDLHALTNSWDENFATWNRRTSSALWNKPGGDYNSKIFSSNTISTLGNTFNENHYKWSIDPAFMQSILSSPNQNIGFLLKSASEGTATYKKFYSGDSVNFATYSPLLSITYYSNSRLGLEDYWDFEQNELTDGMSYVNIGTGNNVVQFEDFSIKGRGKTGITFTRTYNSKSVEGSSFGYGWSHTGGESVTENLKDKSIIYTENDGTVHPFQYNSTKGTYTSPAGKYLTLKKINNGIYEINDKYGNIYRFKQVYQDGHTSDYIIANLEYEEDRNGNRVSYSYSQNGNLTSITDASGRKLTVGYGYHGINQIAYDGKKFTYHYDYYGKLIEVRKYLDSTNYVSTKFNYTSVFTDPYEMQLGQLTSIEDPNGYKTIFNYENGYLTSVEQPSISGVSAPIITYDYDIYNYVSYVTDPNGATTEYYLNNNYVVERTEDALGQITTYKLDDNYNPIQITDPSGYVTVNQYDEKGDLLSTKDPNGNIVKYTYDSYSNRLTATDDKGVTTYHYNSFGDLESEINPLNEVTSYGYDSFGNLKRITLPDGTVETYDYDELGNYIKSVTDPLGNKTVTSTDSLGNITSVTDPKGFTTGFKYDNRKLLKSVTNPNGDLTAYEYDKNGNLKTVKNALLKTNTFEYNAQNLLTKHISPLNKTTKIEYDDNGNQVKVIKPNLEPISYGYNSLSQQTSLSINNKKLWTFTYDPNGNLKTVMNMESGINKSYSYDGNNNLKSESHGNHLLTHTYDSVDQKISTEAKIGSQSFKQEYKRDSLNRMEELHQNNSIKAKFSYYPNGLADETTYQNGIRIKSLYDKALRIESFTIYNNVSPLYNFNYGYDSNGNINSIISNNGNISYDYNKINQLVSETLEDGTQFSYQYDKVGNRTSKIKTKDGAQEITNYRYNDDNQLVAVNGQNYLYDDNGNLKKDQQFNYKYNALDQLIEVTTLSGQLVAKYSYDEEGRRISKQKNGKTIFYHYDENRVLYETDENDNILLEYAYDDNGLPVTMTMEGQSYYYLLNPHGDVLALTNEKGETVASYVYDAWGNIISQTGPMASANPFRYAGYRYDEDTKLYYLMARYYNPEKGVFLSKDPVFGDMYNPLSQNGYGYANNNPVMLLDPDGEAAVALGVYLIPGIGQVTLMATGAVILGGVTYKAGTWLGKKVSDYYNTKVRSKEPIGKRKRFNTRKRAKEAAKRAGNGEPIHHPNGKHGPHFHPNVPKKDPRSHDHYYYPKNKR